LTADRDKAAATVYLAAGVSLIDISLT